MAIPASGWNLNIKTTMKYLIFCLALFFSACGNSEPATAKQEVEQMKPVEEKTPEMVIDSSFDINYITGHFDPTQHPDFTRIEDQYTDKQDVYLRKDTYEAFLKMYAAAEKEGIKLLIRSATRNFDYQKSIWEAKWEGRRELEAGETAPKAYPDPKERALAILRYSSMPGTSRHHWGTDMDLNAFTNSYFEKGEGKKIYDWLTAHAAEYGFCQPYSAGREHGYNEERWHWSYLPVAKQLTYLAKTQLKDENIKGFKGDETSTAIGVVKKYVLGINEDCL